jgi:membrane-associated phospholipid phosphatase
MQLNRRSMILGASATLCAGFASTKTSAYPASDRRINPVLFWNEACLDLNALDHSVAVEDARAPGPCASATALGVVHSVIADAVYLAYGTNYRPQFYRGRSDFHIELPELFVGGAAAGILTHIFNTPTHGFSIGQSGDRFKELLGAPDSKDWQAGLAFGNSRSFRSLWAWERMQLAIMPQFANYVPRPRGHNIDPHNASQGFYGSAWGNFQPLVLDDARQVAHLAAAAPPPEGSPEYERDLAEVRVKGALRSRSDAYFQARTVHETNVGLFWAYDGARRLGTPPRLYNQILRQIAIADRMNVIETARLFALCNLAMADVGIVTWWAKYRYNVWRPILGIQNHARYPEPGWLPLGSPKTNPIRGTQTGPAGSRRTAQSIMGGGDQVLEGPEIRQRKPAYRDAAFTPNFPSYPSGHASFGAACFTMLKLLRSERPQTRHNPDAIHGEFVSEELNGVSIDHFSGTARDFYPIAYKSIDDMIADNERSRVYLGVHWRFDCNRGSESGRRVARAIYDAAYVPYDGFHRPPS